MSAVGKTIILERGRVRGIGADVATAAAAEVTLVPRLLSLLSRRARWLILAGITVFVALVGVAILVLGNMTRDTAGRGATAFAAALSQDAPRLAPSGGAAYVSGVTAYFGPVRSARVIGAHNKSVGHGDEAHTFGIADVLLQTRRGPAVIELAFDNGAFNSTAISGVHEVAPAQADGLSSAQRRQLEAAFAARGGHAADEATLASATPGATRPAPPQTVAAPKPVHVAPVVDPQLRCVQQAHGDVTKLQRCAAS